MFVRQKKNPSGVVSIQVIDKSTGRYKVYSELWFIERAYRITKGTLEMRPMFHFTPKRIEAQVCICFVAYKVYKELERILKLNGFSLSVDKV